MKLRTKPVDLALAAGIMFLVVLVGIASYSVYGEAGITPLVAIATGIIVFVQIELMRRSDAAVSRLKNEAVNDFRQVESLLQLVAILRPDPPLPDTRNGAASPDFLAKTVEVMASQRPKLVVEAGSGVSTLVIGYYLKHLGAGRVIALEHDPVFANTAREWIRLHGLEAHASVVDTPLTPGAVAGFAWYDMHQVQLGAAIDLLIVDGPPGNTGHLARYPALPALYSVLSDDAMILMDDGLRADEALTAKRWTAEYPDLAAEFLHLEKGAYLLKRVRLQ